MFLPDPRTRRDMDPVQRIVQCLLDPPDKVQRIMLLLLLLFLSCALCSCEKQTIFFKVRLPKKETCTGTEQIPGFNLFSDMACFSFNIISGNKILRA